MDSDDFLSPEARKVLNALGNAGAIIQWYAVTADNEAVAPEASDIDPKNLDPNSFVVVWPDETATLITTAHTEDPYP